jgi:tRNA(Ile)-lysidine synthase
VAAARLAAIPPARGAEARVSFSLRAVHVNHQLQPASGAWATHCRRLCRGLGVPLTVRRVRVPQGRGVSVEAAAREVRYAALARELRRGETLLTAHHLDDQCETLLLQLLRGAGVSGLAAMPARAPFARGELVRPLLDLPRATLEGWLRSAGIGWVEDASNDDRRFDRNYLRHEVIPRLEARWPAAAALVARSAGHLGEAREMLADLAALDLQSLVRGAALDSTALGRLSAARQRNAVRAWIAASGLPLPDSRLLARVLGELRAARADAAPLVAWAGAEIRRHRSLLYALRPLGPPPAGEWTWDLSASQRLPLGDGLGELVLVRDPHGPIARKALPRRLRVSLRAGGERLRTDPGGPRRTLKEWLRAQGVLPWMRSRVPLLQRPSDGALVAVADLAVTPEFARGATRGGCRIEWRNGPQVRADVPATARESV